MLLRIVAIIFPVFAIIAAGYFYARRKQPDMSFANQLNMDIFVPALVFAALANKSFDLSAYWPLAMGAVVVVLGSGLLAWPVARLMKVDTNTLVPPMMFSNTGNMGIPLLVLAFGEAALPAAVMIFLAENLLHYALGTWMLDHHAKWWNLWRVPVILASLAGLAVSVVGVVVWPPLLMAIKMLGDVCIPLLLFSLGVRLAASSAQDWRLGITGAILCPLSGMAMAVVIAHVLDLPTDQRGMLLVMGALPPAVLNYIFAEKYRQEPAKVASIVVIGNVASLAFIPLALFWALP
ncbi:MAG: AEC family transporter [Zoogloeaceae bacterium]|nr:AEC family transporter [Zoogloeaceae bacterium]